MLSMQRRRIVYILILAASVVLAVGYVERRQLQERYTAFLQQEREIEAAKRQIAEMERDLTEEEVKARNLENDPVEVEAAIRRIRRGVRDGETLFRVEPPAPLPSTAETPALPEANP